ncbi:MAG: galactokinase [Verrucomicrobiae bacterium]|nr:galactokinase [Verrucomicrobiae bacterium]
MPSPIADLFASQFGRQPEIAVRAPGRINLIGEHVDYLDGLVLPAAIGRSITGAAARNDNGTVRLWSELAGTEPVSFHLDELSPRSGADKWLNYIIGVLAQFRAAGVEPPGFDAVFTADLPIGAGLSSSAALETATALVVEGLTGVRQDPVDRALLCQKAEHDYAGVPCGIMDQLAVGVCQPGQALLIDCRDLSLTPVPIPEHWALVVADTRVKHALGDGEYRKRREDCEETARLLGVTSLRDASLAQVEAASETLGDRLFHRARHAVTEIARVSAFAAALAEQDEATIGRLMREGHESLRDDFEVSCPELDHLVEAAYSAGPALGLIGSRMTGGGFGGSTISIVHREHADAFARHLEVAFSARFAHDPSVFVTAAAGGAAPIPF